MNIYSYVFVQQKYNTFFVTQNFMGLFYYDTNTNY